MAEEIEPVDRQVGLTIAALRVAKGLNQTQLGAALGVSFQQIQKYEKGTNWISASKMYMAAAALDVSVADFFPAPGEAMILPGAPTTTPAGRRLIAALGKLDQREIGALADAAHGLGAGR